MTLTHAFVLQILHHYDPNESYEHYDWNDFAESRFDCGVPKEWPELIKGNPQYRIIERQIIEKIL